LFTDAARSVSPKLKFGRRTQATVAQIVRRLEGVPLALILAAGRLRYMSLVELKEQLEKGSLDVLKRRAVGRDRHADLSSVVDDSFGLLPDRERETLVQLTVFQGGFFLPDAEAVLGSGRAIRDSVTELRDHSLLITQVSQGRMRYRSLDVISEFAARRADEAALAPLRARHAAHYAARAAEVRGRFDAGQWQDANARLWADLGNFQRAMGFALATADADIIRKFAATLARILMEAGLRSDFERLALAAEEISERDGDLALHLEITGLLGGMYRRDNKRELAERYWTARAETYAQTGDSEGEADAWNDLAGLAQTWGDNAALDRYLAEFERLAGRLPRGPVGKEPCSTPGLRPGCFRRSPIYPRASSLECCWPRHGPAWAESPRAEPSAGRVCKMRSKVGIRLSRATSSLGWPHARAWTATSSGRHWAWLSRSAYLSRCLRVFVIK
ncbi:MAG: hypothetical protein HY248_03300, partial [Fimbriimonas ginsengisoli]|nr:hypothetical protein [Fimbriimonas ginsengisoli]